MSNYTVSDSDLTSIAGAIRTKGGTVMPLAFPDEFVEAIGDIETGGGGSVDLFYVTPEEFGAVGDGVTDDSEAVQDACDAGYAVYFASGKTYYLASAVTIDHDCHLFGGEGATIKTKTPSGGTVNDAIVVSGTLKKTTTLTTDYTSTGATANSGNQFTLSDMTGISIGDILVVEATDQYYSYARQYYYLGAVLLVSDIYDGHIYTSNSMPWDIENTEDVSVQVYSAPTAIIENLNFVSDLDGVGSYKYLVKLDRCKNSIVRNCNLTQMGNGVGMYNCVNTLIDNVSVSKSKYDNSSEGDGYGILIYSSSDTIIQRVLAICSQGCVDIGGQIPCINTYVRNCNLTSECRAIGIDMHENSYNIVVEDCTLAGLSLYGTAVVNRCRFIKNNRTASTGAIILRGSHDPRWSSFKFTNCDFDDSLQVDCDRPYPQSPIQAFDNVFGSVEVYNCTGGRFIFRPDTTSDILSNSIQRLIIRDWIDCYDLYLNDSVIDYAEIMNSSFTSNTWLVTYPVTGDSAFNHDYIKTLVYKSNYPITAKMAVNKTTLGEKYALPEGVSLHLSSSNTNAQYIVCGANLASNDDDDYYVGYVGGSEGSVLVRTPYSEHKGRLSTDGNGNLVYTQPSNSSTELVFYPVGMFYVKEHSTIQISATLKNTGETSGAGWYPYIAIVDCDTGKIYYRGNGSYQTATAQGVTISHTYGAPKNSVAMAYFYNDGVVQGSETTFEDLSVTCTPSFAPPVAGEPYTAKRLTGNGIITSLSGVNNIMCSEDNFNVKFVVDYVDNPLCGVQSSGG